MCAMLHRAAAPHGSRIPPIIIITIRFSILAVI